MARYLKYGLIGSLACIALAILGFISILFAPTLGASENETVSGLLPVALMILLMFSAVPLILSAWAEIFKAKNDKTWKIIWFAVTLFFLLLPPVFAVIGIGAYYFIGRKEMKE